MSQPIAEFLKACPLCGGRIEVFTGPNNHTMGTCVDCAMSFVVPMTAWNVASREGSRQSQAGTAIRASRGVV